MPSLKLLIVEDDVASLELMTEVFTSLEAEVCAISDSKKAPSLVNQQRFDGIFLDLEMPKPDGFELARLIRLSSWNKSTPIVIVTGLEDRQIMQQAFSLGATFFLQKPVDRRKLSNLFRTIRGGLIENRRRHTRVPLRTEVTCEVGTRTLRGTTWNLSQGGIQVEADSLRARDTVRLSFRLPISEITVEAVGVVAWAGEKRQGIQFTNVNTVHQQSIRDFVAAVEE